MGRHDWYRNEDWIRGSLSAAPTRKVCLASYGATIEQVRTVDRLIQLKPKINDIARQHGAGNVRVFGSAARGEDRAESDIDMLVTLEAGRTLLDLVGLEQDLTKLLGRKVDVVVEGGISPYLEPIILSEAIAI